MSAGFLRREPGFVTQAIHEGQEPEQWNSRACVPPIFTSVTFKQDAPAEHRGYTYGRAGNPSRNILEGSLASLDRATHGLAFSSGMGAVTTVTALLAAGDHMIAGLDQYGTTTAHFKQVLSRWNITTTFLDMSDLASVEVALQDNTKMVWLETPTNPILKVTDIKLLAEIVHKKDKGIMLVVDNTFLTPYFQLPLSLGADIVVNSLSKYMNGHSDALVGAVTTNSENIHSRLRTLQNLLGAVPSPFECYLVSRGLKTLGLRMEQHMKTGLKVADYLEAHACVERVIHPGLPSHPQHELSKRQCYGHSGMLSFQLKGNLEEAKTFLKSLRLFTLSGGVGATESQVELSCLMSQACVPAEDRRKLGISDTLVRMSVGLEDADMLIQDLKQALSETYTNSLMHDCCSSTFNVPQLY